MMLCALAAVLSGTGWAWRLSGIVVRTVAAVLIAWATAYVLWPWLQIGNPFLQFKEAFQYFANHPAHWGFVHWGYNVMTDALPWHYVPGQMAARLPEGFLVLVVVGLVAGIATAARYLRRGYDALAARRRIRVQTWLLSVARSRGMLVVWVAALIPVASVIIQRSTLYDGIRHVLFLIPMAALIGAYGFVRLFPLLRRFAVVSAVGLGAYVGYATLTLIALHPLQYVSANVLTGGVPGANERFDQDYWAVAATTALRQLEQRLDLVPDLFAKKPPRIMICVRDRLAAVRAMYRRPWRLATDPAEADYLIESERWRCAKEEPDFVLIDEVRRGGPPFAWTFARRPHPDLPRPPQE
jgi:hypothetical protein